MELLSSSTVFNNHLTQLCLDNFPCGLGPWREDYNYVNSVLYKEKDRSKLMNNVDHHYTITLKDGDASSEKTEVLSEYVSSKNSPWTIDYSWSDEAKSLRELSITSPWLITPKLIFSHFKTLRMVDKKITVIDENIALFQNLEELILSANYITKIDSTNLPPKLKVLELCANEIADISGLVIKPPPLNHLGLGMNQLNSFEYITNQYWPQLLSLDLNGNHLTNILEVVRDLSTLPKLRCLILQGNPLSLVPGYRGFVVDSLRSLLILDDLRISADEKHNFKGLARRKEYILDEVKVRFALKGIKNLPIPDELKCPEDFPEFPVIAHRYFVKFWYPKDSVPVVDLNDEEKDQTQSEGNLSEIPEVEDSEPKLTTELNETQVVEEVGAAETVLVHSVECLETRENEEGIVIAPICSEPVGYSAEDIDLEWFEVVTREDTFTVRNFFKKNLEFELVEEKSLLYPPDELPVEETKPSSAKKGDKGKKEEKERKKSHSKRAPSSTKEEPPKKDDKAKKKKKVDESQLVTYSTEFITLETFQLPLECFIRGEYNINKILVSGGGELPPQTAAETVISQPEEGKKNKGKDDKKSKPEAKSAKSSKPGGKAKEDEGEEEEEVAPPLLQIELDIELVHWNSVKDSIKQEDIQQPIAPAVA